MYADEASAQAAVLTVLHTAPEGHGQSRWTLALLREACEWLQQTSLSGICQLLARLGIRHKRARAYLHSPDEHYIAKVAYLQECWQTVVARNQHLVLVYLDEFAFERQPSLASAYAARGSKQPLARLSYRTNTLCRGLGALNVLTGQLTYRQRSHITAKVLEGFYHQLCQDYPQAETIYVVQDNWPVHVYPDLVARLQPQRSPFWPHVPDNWPAQPSPPGQHDGLPIQLVFLPTYAPWLNPIEKLWRWVRQDVLHLHRLADDWEQLKLRVLDFMAQFHQPSPALLRSVGLLPH